MASPSKEPVPPTHLLEGTSLLDLRDIEVALRAGFSLAIFDALQKEVESFVAAGCPLKRDKKLRTTMTNAISLSFAAFRGADQWQAARQGAIQRAMEDADESRAALRRGQVARARIGVKRSPALARARFKPTV